MYMVLGAHDKAETMLQAAKAAEVVNPNLTMEALRNEFDLRRSDAEPIWYLLFIRY